MPMSSIATIFSTPTATSTNRPRRCRERSNAITITGSPSAARCIFPKVYNTAKNKIFFFWSEEWRKVSFAGNCKCTASHNKRTEWRISPARSPTRQHGCVAYDPATNQSTISGYSQNASVYLTNLYDKFPANTRQRPIYLQFLQLNNTREDLVRFD